MGGAHPTRTGGADVAINYWNGYSDSTSTSTWDYSSTTTTNSSTDTWYTYTVCAQEYIVPRPKGWNDDDSDAFTRLLNIETHTGWIVKMQIRGDIQICDPRINVREMKDMLPLILSRANQEDAKKINKFFKQHSIEEGE